MIEKHPNEPGIVAARPKDRRGRLLRKILAAQAWWMGGWGGHPELPPSPSLTPTEAKECVRRSPRANGYLSLESETRLFGEEGLFLGYSAWGRNTLIAGGIHGPREAHGTLLHGFKEALEGRGFKRILSFPVAPNDLDVYREAGFQMIQAGAEASLDVPGFSLAGPRRESLRQMVNRARKRFHLEMQEVKGENAGARLGPVYERWLQSRRRGYRLRLLVGTPSFDQPLDRRFFAAVDAETQRPWAFLTLTPGWNGEGSGLDVLARDPQAPPGTVDLLISEVVFQLQREGVTHFSLGSCPLVEAGALDPNDPRLIRWAFRQMRDKSWGNSIFRFRSLYRFKQKFAPRWDPVYIAGWPNVGVRALYTGCRMWGLFGPPKLRVD